MVICASLERFGFVRRTVFFYINFVNDAVLDDYLKNIVSFLKKNNG